MNSEGNSQNREPLAVEKLKMDFIQLKKHSFILRGNVFVRFLSQYVY